MYYYAHVLSVAPRRMKDALSWGTMFHGAIEPYYKALAAGKSHQDAMLECNQVVLQYAQRDAINASKVQIMLMNYFKHFGDERGTWKVESVEGQFKIPLTADYEYTMRLDLMMLHIPTGEYWLWDHKTTYDFWSEDDLALSVQFPKYIGTLRFNNRPVIGCIVNQIRTREKRNPDADYLFRRTPVRYNEHNIRRTLKEQIVSAQEITAFRRLPDPIREQQAVRCGNKYICKICDFRPLCIAELQGNDIQYLLETEYQENKYDREYNPVQQPSEDW